MNESRIEDTIREKNLCNSITKATRLVWKTPAGKPVVEHDHLVMLLNLVRCWFHRFKVSQSILNALSIWKVVCCLFVRAYRGLLGINLYCNTCTTQPHHATTPQRFIAPNLWSACCSTLCAHWSMLWKDRPWYIWRRFSLLDLLLNSVSFILAFCTPFASVTSYYCIQMFYCSPNQPVERAINGKLATARVEL